VPSCTVAPPSSSHPAAVFASPLLLLAHRAITAPPPPRGPRSARIRAAPSAAARAGGTRGSTEQHHRRRAPPGRVIPPARLSPAQPCRLPAREEALGATAAPPPHACAVASVARSHLAGSAPATSRSSCVRSAPRCCPRAGPHQATCAPPLARGRPLQRACAPPLGRPLQRRTSRSRPLPLARRHAVSRSSAPAPRVPSLLQRSSAAHPRQRRAHSRARLRRALPALPEPRGGERGAAGVEIGVEAKEGDADGGEKESAREKRNRGEGEMEFSQGLVHKFRKLQGPIGKVKFLINLKP
jgi:hypothetical protein